MNIFLNRLYDDGTRTLGRLIVYDGLDSVCETVTLEPPWKQNERNVSCIPIGRYTLKPRRTAKFGDHYHVTDVHGRSWILFHVGNFPHNTSGCVLIGSHFVDFDGDGRMDIGESKKAFERLRKTLGASDDHNLYVFGPVPKMR